MSREKKFNMIRTAVSMLASVFVAFIIIVMVSEQPLESIKIFLVNPFSSMRYIGNMIETAIPLIFSGLAMAILFKTGLFNLGGEGVFFMAGIVGSMVAIWVDLPSPLLPFLCLLAGMAAGVGVMLIPGVLRAKYGASEMVTSLMMNSIAYGVGCYVLNNIMRDPSVSSLVSYKYRHASLLPIMVRGTRIHIGIILAILSALFVSIFMYKTKKGYELRIAGTNSSFAKYSGINVKKVIIMAHILAGAVAGLGGIVECLGIHKRFEWASLPGYGFDGAMIAMMANNNPFGVIGAALFVGYLRVGADLVNRFADVPTEMIAILQSIIILLISADKFLHKYKQKFIEKEVKHERVF
ncbi:ABC transporter permease [Lachnospiraceae bacterium ZAX-1]